MDIICCDVAVWHYSWGDENKCLLTLGKELKTEQSPTQWTRVLLGLLTGMWVSVYFLHQKRVVKAIKVPHTRVTAHTKSTAHLSGSPAGPRAPSSKSSVGLSLLWAVGLTESLLGSLAGLCFCQAAGHVWALCLQFLLTEELVPNTCMGQLTTTCNSSCGVSDVYDFYKN